MSIEAELDMVLSLTRHGQTVTLFSSIEIVKITWETLQKVAIGVNDLSCSFTTKQCTYSQTSQTIGLQFQSEG